MSDFITSAEQATSAWLTEALRNADALDRGAVQSVQYESNAAFNSAVTHLRLTYSPDALTTAPCRLLLKLSLPSDWAAEAGATEVAFYRLVASLPDHPQMTARCYAAEYDQAGGQSYLLLEDLSTTHRTPLTRDQQITFSPSVPAPAYIDQVVDVLARFHAYWWQHPLLGSDLAQMDHWFRDEAHYAQYIQRRTTALADLLDHERANLPTNLPALLEQALANLASLWDRYWGPRVASFRNLTLVHGDTYFANFLCPRDPAEGRAYLIDWQSVCALRGSDDLANLCATFWTPADRHENDREQRILRRYHDLLQIHGVTDYSWENLAADYKLAVTDWLFVAVQDRYSGSRRDYWLPKLQCLAAAYQDLHCAEAFSAF